MIADPARDGLADPAGRASSGCPLGSAFGPSILVQRARRRGDRPNGELHRDLPRVVRPRRRRGHRRLEQGLGRARRPDHVRDRDRRAAPAAAQHASRASTTRPISSWQNAANVRPIPRELLRLPEVKWALRGLRVALRRVPRSRCRSCSSEKDTNLAAAVIIYAIIAISLVLLTGWAGEISLGQVAFVAIGSAAAGAANVHWQLDPFLSFLARGRGRRGRVDHHRPPRAPHPRALMLAVTTLAFAVMTSSFLLNRDQSLLGIKFDYLPDDLIDRVTRFPQWTPFGHIGIGDDGAHPERDLLLHVPSSVLLPRARRGARAPAVANRARPHRDARQRAQRAGVPAEPDQCEAARVRARRASSRRSPAASSCSTSRRSARTSSPRSRASACSPWWSSAGSARCPARSSARSSSRAPSGSAASCPQRFRFLVPRSPGAASGSSSCCGCCPVASARCSTGCATRGCAAVARRRNLVVPSLIADAGDDPELLTGKAKPAVAVADRTATTAKRRRRRSSSGASRRARCPTSTTSATPTCA